ncbi:hypothetical protein LN533_09700 [Xanthomonas vesicatoria]|nr:hypothetical protein [Xanthomonas vesicatoria]MCC8694359.1 hypothetical protein [Xanthomonas vesicatoria]MCC8702515.1 hypothetical protein [Xanthomonas vesicatoria]MDG4489683.1 hypothetical protein [Xanthomonas vesicatoria]
MIDFAALVVPFVIPLCLPFPLVWVYLFGAMLAQWAENKLRGAVDATWVWWLGACFGVSVALGLRVGTMFAGIVAGGASFAALLLAGRVWEKVACLNIPRHDPGPTIMRIQGVERPLGTAHAKTALMTPEGLRLRVVGCHEPRNSAPLQYDYLFPDGSVVFGAGASMGYSPNGRYFVSPMPTTGTWRLLIYDRHTQWVYRCNKVETFVAIQQVTQTHVEGWGSRVEKDGRMLSASIEDLIAHSVNEPMVDIEDLKIPESYADRARQQRQVELPPAPAGAPALMLAAYLPSSLMTLDDPLEPLFSPRLELIVDGQPSGLLVDGRHPMLRWGDDGRSLTCVAKRKGSIEQPAPWMWNAQRGWCAGAEVLSQC